MPDRTCSVEGCERPHQARGLCLMHYRRHRKAGLLDLLPKPTGCSVDGCEGKHEALGFCAMHYARWKAHGDPLADRPPVQRRPRGSQAQVCAAEGCESDAASQGLCPKHYSRLQRHGRLGHPHPRHNAPAGQHWCSKCQEYRRVQDFYSHRGRFADLSDACKACQNAATKDWLGRHPEFRRSQALARRGGVSSADSEPFTRQEIADRDGWLCQLCLQAGKGKRAARIDPALQWPDPGSLSIDHVIPLNPAEGEPGRHERCNVQAAHLSCNWSKNNRGTDQLRLFG